MKPNTSKAKNDEHTFSLSFPEKEALSDLNAPKQSPHDSFTASARDASNVDKSEKLITSQTVAKARRDSLKREISNSFDDSSPLPEFINMQKSVETLSPQDIEGI